MKRILTAVLAFCIPFSPVFAETRIKTDVEGAQFIISGDISSAAKVGEVSVNILKPGKTPEDVIAGEVTDAVEYSIQTPANGDGSFIINAPIKGASGKYTVYVDYEGNTDKAGRTVSFVRKEDNDAAIKALFDAKSGSETTDVLRQKWDLLDIQNELYDKIDASGAAKIFFNVKNEKKPAAAEMTHKTAQKYFDIACTLEAVSEGIVSELSEYFGLLELEGEPAVKYYTKGGSSRRAAAAEILKARDISSIGKMKAAFAEATVLATVEYPDGIADVKNVIIVFAGEIGISAVSDNSKTYSSLMGRKFSSYSELASAYADADNSGGGGGGGSSAGGSGKGGGKGGSGSAVRGGNGAIGSVVIGNTEVSVPENISQSIVFSDIESVPWAKEAISELYKKKVVSGMGDGSFRPNDAVTREQFVTMIVNAFELKAKDGKAEFTDVTESDWFCPYVSIAFENGIIRGQGTRFGAGESLTREDMAVIIFNTLNNLGRSLKNDEKESFSDIGAVSDYAKESVEYLKNAGIIKGSGDNEFIPKGITTRAEAAVVIYSVLNNG